MAFRTWARVLSAALCVGALAAAGQLGVAYGLRLVRIAHTFDITVRDHWVAQLTWVCWIAMVAGILGTVAAGRLAPRPPSGGTAALLAVVAAVGASTVAPLTMLPARSTQAAGLDPVLAVALCAGLGTVVGAMAGYLALAHPVARWSLATTIGAVWTIGIGCVLTSIAAADPPPVRLGVLDAGSLVTTQRAALLTMPALALLSGAALGWVARRQGRSLLTVGLAGLPGPTLLTLAYLIAGPGDSRYQQVPYWAATLAAGAGSLGSVLAAVIGRDDERSAAPEDTAPEGPESKGPESKGPESKGPESKGPESKGPESEGPGFEDAEPGAAAPDGGPVSDSRRPARPTLRGRVTRPTPTPPLPPPPAWPADSLGPGPGASDPGDLTPTAPGPTAPGPTAPGPTTPGPTGTGATGTDAAGRVTTGTTGSGRSTIAGPAGTESDSRETGSVPPARRGQRAARTGAGDRTSDRADRASDRADRANRANRASDRASDRAGRPPATPRATPSPVTSAPPTPQQVSPPLPTPTPASAPLPPPQPTDRHPGATPPGATPSGATPSTGEPRRAALGKGGDKGIRPKDEEYVRWVSGLNDDD